MLNFIQKTIKEPVELNGIGLHNGVKVNICLKPAEPNSGIKFKRIDVEKNNIIEANYKNVNAPILCTKIANSSGITVSTVEHLMAALYGEEIDNLLVEIDAGEVPIMDGSAIDFVDAIRTVGTENQKISRKFIKVLKKIEVREGAKYISIEPLEKDLIIDFEIVYKNPLIRTRRKEFRFSDGDLNPIYNSRTFCLYEDIAQIKKQGLAQGGSLENAIVVQENEILNDEGLRSRHEFVEHKILDCLGDILLSGYRIFGHIKTSQGGHYLTNTLLRKLFAEKSNWVLEDIEGKQIDTKDATYKEPITARA
jgi:UDP-3-O-[3-hydroxymyristoyl] N-acetylglucosamine deacetylase